VIKHPVLVTFEKTFGCPVEEKGYGLHPFVQGVFAFSDLSLFQ